ncbi:hypothetical protein PARMER_04280 [Parabacteroides merdae ATCC 43184]|nr:hypothetical protein PARMER_04280 [Parabacteroides merdae ATCC 43184]
MIVPGYGSGPSSDVIICHQMSLYVIRCHYMSSDVMEI